MLQTVHTIINATIETGIPLKRWLSSTLVKIEKVPSTHQIIKLRVINIYEGDYILMLMFFWPRLTTRYAETTKNLGGKQRGFRPNYSVDNVALIHELVTEVHYSNCSTI